MPIPMVMLNNDIKTSNAYMEYLTKAKRVKPTKGHGSGVILEVPDEPKGISSTSSSESDDEIEDISNEKVGAEQNVDDHARNEQAGDVQAKVHESEPQIEKPVATLISSSLIPSLVDTTVILIPETTTLIPKQPPQPPKSRRKTKVLLKKSKKPETQVDNEVLDNRLTRLEKKVEAMSKFNIPDAIDKSVQAHLKKNVLPKDKDKLLQLMRKSKSYNKHPAHKALYDALMQSLIIDEDDIDKQFKDQSTPKKRHRDDNDQDPSIDTQKEKKKRKQKDSEFSKKDKDQARSSNKGTSPSKSSKTDKHVNVEETIHDVKMDVGESIKDDGVDAEDPTQANASVPKRDKSTWFKTVVVERPDSPNPEWHKEPTADDVTRQSGSMKW
ncbi:hypothetical protein Tco_0111846 [Tanacetum coccineum]